MSKTAKMTLVLMGTTIIAKILGFFKTIVLASSYGTTIYSDSYLIALNIPSVIFSAVVTAISTTFIPMYYTVDNNDDNKEKIKYVNNILNIVIVLSILICIISLIFIKPLVHMFAIGFKGEALEVTIKFSRIMIFGIIFIGISNIMSSYLQVSDNFTIPGLIGIPFNIIIIVSMIISTNTNPYIMAYGTVIAMLSQLLFQVPFAYKKGYKYNLYINLKEDYIKCIIKLVCPVFIGVAANQVNVIIDKTLASTLGEGSVSALSYANKLNLFVIGLFITSIVTVIYPKLSKLAKRCDLSEFVDVVVKSINSIIILVLPITAGAIVLSKPIVKILFERGAFDIDATKMTSIALIFYSIGMIGFGLREMLAKVFYSLHDTKTPMINGAMSMGINIILNLILVRFGGYWGLALATSLSSIICVILLFNSLKNKIEYLGEDKIIKTTLKSILASFIMSIITYLTYNLFNKTLGFGFINEVFALIGSIGIGFVTYATLVIVLRVEETKIIIEKLKIIYRKINV